MNKAQFIFFTCGLFLAVYCILPTTALAQLNEKVGIGVRLQSDSSRGYKTTVVLALVPNSNAEATGLQQGDIIQKVNEQSISDLELEEVVAMIVGKEGTEVKLSIERNGKSLSYNIMRGKYKYATTWHNPAVKDNEFCSALAKLMNDAPYDFANTMDTIKQVDKNGYYVSKISIPGVESIGMDNNWGVSCIISIGSYSTMDEVNVAGTKIIEQVKGCFPDYYYEPAVTANGSVSVSIGKTYANGYESPILQLFTVYEKTEQTNKLRLRINGGKATRYYTIDKAAEKNSIAGAVKIIYDDVLNNFSNVKGEKHEVSGGGLFAMSSWWYDVSPLPDGASSCSISEGGLNLGGGGCRCRFYLSTDRDEAVLTFNRMFDELKTALGSEFVYSFDKSNWDMSIPKDAESVITFGKKKKHDYESDLPLIVLTLEKYTDNSYAVNILFYKFGF